MLVGGGWGRRKGLFVLYCPGALPAGGRMWMGTGDRRGRTAASILVPAARALNALEKRQKKNTQKKNRNLNVFWEIRLLPALFFPGLGCLPFAGIKTGGKRRELRARGRRRRGAALGFGALLSPGRWVRPRSSRSEIRLKRPKITLPAATSPTHTPLTRAALCLRQVPYALTLTI